LERTLKNKNVEIERGNDIDKISFSVRMKVTKAVFNDLKKYLDLNFKYLLNLKEKHVILVIDIESIESPSILISMIEKYELQKGDYDLYFDILSSYDMGGITLPQNIVDLIKLLDCEINFSYTIS
jgi:hypothetical protein